jgi:hypothetical protein
MAGMGRKAKGQGRGRQRIGSFWRACGQQLTMARELAGTAVR